MSGDTTTPPVSISPLLLQLADPTTTLYSISASEIAAAVALIFSNSISPVQTGCLLYALHSTQLDRRPDILAACAQAMRDAASQTDIKKLREVVKSKNMAEGRYEGGLLDIVGTGGDSHNTYNVSTTSSILASPLLLMAKHGNNASTSRSGSADLLLSSTPPPAIEAANPHTLSTLYTHTNYAFLYAREWHPGMKHAASVRRELPFRTIFNLLGPLANPVHNSNLIEARVLGVAKKDMGPVFADALRLSGAKKALVVCGEEDLDEISCAGPTRCWLLRRRTGSGGDHGWVSTSPSRGGYGSEDVEILPFSVRPEDFGLGPRALSEVAGGKSPAENAGILKRLLAGELEADDPVLTFVLMNTAALLAVSGICEADTSKMGEGDDGKVIEERGPGGLRWKEGVRRARWCISSGAAKKQWESYVKTTQGIVGGS
ncbi:glycosyl transferase [Elsinoe ampelina]|uniref:Glycosyl transferase n=1 Tax=Elsinoe ampelina TaxID=302913 RepID=A0A6A6GBD7_9PEZI|nr:glycosyl transferase [Elsinoe ampelina]